MKYDLKVIKEQLFAPCLVDILDDLGYRNQGMDSGMRPLVVNSTKFMGKARTMLACEVYEIPEYPYQKELTSLDLMQKDDVMVATTQGSMCAAFFGELMANRCAYSGVVGAVIDGATRDTGYIEEMGFPLFCRGVNPMDSKGRIDVIAYDVPVMCGGVLVTPGDIIYADRDGVVVIPESIAEKVIDLTLEKMSMENVVRNEIRSGTSVAEVYAKYGVL